MERSRSNKRYYYDHHHRHGDYETLPAPPPTTRPPKHHRYNNYNQNNNNHYSPPLPHHNQHRRGSGGGGRKIQDNNQSLTVTTSYRILCHDVRAGGVIGKSGSIIKSIRQHTGAWINVHELVPGDEERIIEISDTRRRDPEGRIPQFSPAQEALFLIHDRILESEAACGRDEEEEEGGGGGGYGGPRGNRAVTRLVVSRLHVGSLLGKGGKIIEQMRMETKTHIRVLPRDHTLPRCVAMSEEIVQVVGDMNAVKSAIAIISSRLRESQHRDRSNFHGRPQSPERFFSPDDDFVPMNNTPRRPPAGLSNGRYDNYGSRSSGFGIESGGGHRGDNAPPVSYEDIVFRILCPIDKVEYVVGDSDGFFEMLQHEIGVDVKVADPVAGSNQQIITISSDEGPDDELFPAQEALLHIQTRIVDLVPEKENIITTRLLIPSGEVGCLEGKDGTLSEMKRLTGANIQIVPREELSVCVAGTDELVQIVGEIKAAREAVVEITSRLRSFMYQDFSQKDTAAPHFAASSPMASPMAAEIAASNNVNPAGDGFAGTSNDPPAVRQFAQPAKDSGGFAAEAVKQPEKDRGEDMLPELNKFPLQLPFVTRSILEVVLPESAVSKLSKNKLSQISELSGANVKLVEDGPDVTEKVIQISGTREQAERAQSLLQGFILSTQD